MASKKAYDLAVKVGEYTDRDGNTKPRYKNIGIEIEREDGGRYIQLDASIINMELQWLINQDHKDRINVSKFEVRENGQQSARAKPAAAPAAAPQPAAAKAGIEGMEDDIPF